MKLAILATNREPRCIERTLASVLASDWPGDIIVSVDPPSRDLLRDLQHHSRVRVDVMPDAEWDVVRDSRVHRRATANYCRCMAIVAGDPEGGIVLEDDVIVRDDLWAQTWNLRSRARALCSDDDYAVLLYSPRNPTKIGAIGALSKMPSDLLYGTQAIYWTADSARRVREHMYAHGVVDDELVQDLLIREYGLQNPRFALMLPDESIAQHVGHTTTGLGSFHSAPSFERRRESSQGVCFLTAGIGGAWVERALRVEARLRVLYPAAETRVLTTLPNWLPCVLPNPSWLKCWGWDLVPSWCDTLVWVDADVIPVRALAVLPDGDFCASPDYSGNFARRALPSLRLDRTYYNAGIWIARRATEPLFRCLQELLLGGVADIHPQFYEQSFLNLVLQQMPLRVTDLPQTWNWMGVYGEPPKDVLMIHRAGSHDRIDQYWEEWAPSSAVPAAADLPPILPHALRGGRTVYSNVRIIRTGERHLVKQKPRGSK